MSAVSESLEQQAQSVYAALARTATRAAALYFSRPVRLFRPSKVNGWQNLRSLAAQHGQSLSAEFMQQLIKKQGLIILPRTFIPPILVNAVLGTVLWETYTITSNVLEPNLNAHPTVIAAMSGAAAGGMQAVIAAPAENVRLAGIGTGSSGGWAGAWREVFRGAVPASPDASKRENVRRVRNWANEVRQMAGNGWEGMGWGFCKDVCGFAAFFAIFDVTRRLASTTKQAAQEAVDILPLGETRAQSIKRHFPRTVHGITLVSGGVVAGLSYELMSRPFDAARRAVQQHSLGQAGSIEPPMRVLLLKIQEDGLGSFFRDADRATASPGSAASRRLYAALRMIARVGPWGVGFLVWEALGPGIS
ncbi:hypothetical protein FIBSPDRAFT_737135 [Athelia psychrophila]|uniref:Mitochondrial carrier n=1 Tax=Athelia psychrophila TaxID=1759441 RepID=A0A166M321_9AGAM|nr:hypothetical protein FIBSPDRAFT_737135 [Fibularhizoctonia sp. CBS 109695]